MANTLTMETFIFTAVTLVVVTGLSLMLKKYVEHRLERGFKKPNTDDLLNHYDKVIINHPLMPEADFMRSYSKALALSLYGEFERSSAELDQYDMSGKGPIYRAMELSGVAVNNYLQRKDLSGALALAKEALSLLENAKGVVPEHRNSYEAFVEIGEIINGNATGHIIAALESRFQKSTFILKLLAAWGLVIAYIRTGNKARADELVKFLSENAPYCKPILRFT